MGKALAGSGEGFRHILLQSPNDFDARNNLALALVEQDQKDPSKGRYAREFAEKNQSEKPNDPNALSTLAWVYFRLNEFDQAALTMNKVVTLLNARLDPDTTTYLAYILDHNDRKWQAKEVLGNILKADQPFAMRPEAQKLYEKVKDAKKPEGTPPAKTP